MCYFTRMLYFGRYSASFDMSDLNLDNSIPDRPAFKAAEVCEIAKLQPFVLRSWESEFPDLGIARTPGGPRVYRKADVERVLQIRHLVFQDGLTLAGARRKLEGTPIAPRDTSADDTLLFDDVLSADAKQRLARIKTGLKNLLDLVSRDPRGLADFSLESPATVAVGASATSSAVVAPKRSSARHTKPKV
jgi:DNA-binding transcriptional MerR regulator